MGRWRSLALIAALAAVAAALVVWLWYGELSRRRVTQEIDRLAKVLALDPTSDVADVGAGGGEYALELASRVVPKGHVFATEIDDDAVSKIRADASATDLNNVTVIRADPSSSKLPTECCDAVFLRGVYHHVTMPAATNRSLFDALRPDGRLAIIDFTPSWFLSMFFRVPGVPSNRGGHGVPPGVVVTEMQQAGLRLTNELDDWSSGQYCLVFQKQSD